MSPKAEPQASPILLRGVVKVTGRLYICPSPLGNLEDITLRVLRTLSEVDMVAAEDTRRTRKLLAHYGISTPVTGCHQHSNPVKIKRLVAAMAGGKNLALVSDAGTPTISDPGQALVRACIDQGIEIDPLPGPCAAITALSASGFPLASFTFKGFLPRKKVKKAVAALADIEHPVVLYESPQRISSLLAHLESHMPDRDILLARELTKFHQQLLRGKPGVLLAQVKERGLERGEFTIVLGPGTVASPGKDLLPDLAQKYFKQGIAPREAAVRISSETGISRREAYNYLHKKKDS